MDNRFYREAPNDYRKRALALINELGWAANAGRKSREAIAAAFQQVAAEAWRQGFDAGVVAKQKIAPE